MKTFKYSFAIVILIFSIVSCSQNEDNTKSNGKTSDKETPGINLLASDVIDGDFVHIVFFWLKDPDNKDIRDNFTSSLYDFIKNSNDIKSFHLGTPANTYRSIIDTSYTYCMIVTFSSKIEHDRYQIDPAHKEFLTNFKDSWGKVQIYDSESIK